jgi:predicted alpha/beta-hydrolase family hydrolase
MTKPHQFKQQTVSQPIKFVHPVSTEEIHLSTRWNEPNNATHAMLLAHGAGANLDHLHMENIANSLANVGIATLRFNLPFMELGKKRTDTIPVCLKAIETAVTHLHSHDKKRPILLAGHSFGGRMMSHFAAQMFTADAIEEALINRFIGLVYFSFPLHVSGKPDIKRAAHLIDIQSPQLFLSGTRDTLAEPKLLTETVSPLEKASIHWLDTADHGFKILKRTRKSAESVYDESARTIRDWLSF